jgi:hypothetical protein
MSKGKLIKTTKSMTLKDEIEALKSESRKQANREFREDRDGALIYKGAYSDAMGDVLALLDKAKCKNCTWWESRDDDNPNAEHYCEHDSLFAVVESEPEPYELKSDLAVISSDDGESSVGAGPNFGCIHFDGRKEDQ